MDTAVSGKVVVVVEVAVEVVVLGAVEVLGVVGVLALTIVVDVELTLVAGVPSPPHACMENAKRAPPPAMSNHGLVRREAVDRGMLKSTSLSRPAPYIANTSLRPEVPTLRGLPRAEPQVSCSR